MTPRINIGSKFIGRGGADAYPVHRIDNAGCVTLGYIRRVNTDVYYVDHADNHYRDNRRYRTWDDALAAIQK